TILRLIVGLVTADTGEIQFDGEKIAAETIMKIRRRLGYVIQDGGLFPHLTARHNLTLQPRLFRKRRDEIEKRIMELCELTKFPGSGLDRYPLELSGGQRQRVSLMRALMLSPELLLLDEPFAALDPLVRMNLQRDLSPGYRRFLLAVASLLLPATLVSADQVIIGSKKFTESYVLAEIAKRSLENAGLKVEHRQGMGGTIILWEALRGGGIDVYPEYTGTIAEEMLKEPGASIAQI